MDIAQLFQAPIVEKVGNVDVSFPMVPLRAVAVIVSGAKALRKTVAVADAESAKLDPVKSYNAIRLSQADFTAADLVDYIDSPAGAEEVIRASLKKHDPPLASEQIDAIVDGMGFTQASNLALRLTGVRFPQPPVVGTQAPQTGRAFGDAPDSSVPPLEPRALTGSSS